MESIEKLKQQIEELRIEVNSTITKESIVKEVLESINLNNEYLETNDIEKRKLFAIIKNASKDVKDIDIGLYNFDFPIKLLNESTVNYNIVSRSFINICFYIHDIKNINRSNLYFLIARLLNTFIHHTTNNKKHYTPITKLELDKQLKYYKLFNIIKDMADKYKQLNLNIDININPPNLHYHAIESQLICLEKYGNLLDYNEVEIELVYLIRWLFKIMNEHNL